MPRKNTKNVLKNSAWDGTHYRGNDGQDIAEQNMWDRHKIPPNNTKTLNSAWNEASNEMTKNVEYMMPQSNTKHIKKGSAWDGTSYRMDLGKDDPNYGTPIPGSKTDLRGKRAGVRVSNEIIECCGIIYREGFDVPNHPGCLRAITFGRIFRIYQSISLNIVGILVRARKHGLLEFEGEMLYQRQDDDVLIRLVAMPEVLINWLNVHEETDYLYNSVE